MFTNLYSIIEFGRTDAVLFSKEDGNDVHVPLCCEEEKVEGEAMKVLAASAIGRNIVCVDAAANPGQLTKRLVAIMKVVFRRNSADTLTTVVVDDLVEVPDLDDLRVLKVDMTDFVNFVEGPLHVKLPHGKINLIIGLGSQHRKSLVIPKVKNKYGVVCLDCKCVLLGAY